MALAEDAPPSGIDELPTEMHVEHLVQLALRVQRFKLRFKFDEVLVLPDKRTIEVAKLSDAEEIISLRSACSVRTEDKTPNGTPFLKPMHKDMLDAMLERGTVLIVKTKGEIAGTIYANRILHRGTALVGGFAVHPLHQKSGNGPALLQESLQRIKTSGFQRAFSITASTQVAQLFEKFGARPCDENEFARELNESRTRFGSDADLVKGFIFELQKTAL